MKGGAHQPLATQFPLQMQKVSLHKTLASNATEPAQEVAGGFAIHLRIHEISQQKQHTGNRDPKPVLAQCTVRKGCPTQPDDENT